MLLSELFVIPLFFLNTERAVPFITLSVASVISIVGDCAVFKLVGVSPDAIAFA